MAIASRNIGRSVKWVEDQLEHLIAVSSAANRITTLEAAVSETGEVLAIDWYQLAPVHYWDTDIRHFGRSMNVQG